jgi:hypothetical protein
MTLATGECGVGGDIGSGCCENLKPKAVTRIRSARDLYTGFRREEQQLTVPNKDVHLNMAAGLRKGCQL